MGRKWGLSWASKVSVPGAFKIHEDTMGCHSSGVVAGGIYWVGVRAATGPGRTVPPLAPAVLLLRTAVRSGTLGGVSVGHSSEVRLSPARWEEGHAYCPGRHSGAPRLCRRSPPSLASSA